MLLFLNSHLANADRVLIMGQALLKALEIKMNKTVEGMYPDSGF